MDLVAEIYMRNLFYVVEAKLSTKSFEMAQ